MKSVVPFLLTVLRWGSCTHGPQWMGSKYIYRAISLQIKPDGVQRGLIAAVIKRFEDKGYKLVAIKVSPHKRLECCALKACDAVSCLWVRQSNWHILGLSTYGNVGSLGYGWMPFDCNHLKIHPADCQALNRFGSAALSGAWREAILSRACAIPLLRASCKCTPASREKVLIL